MLFSTEKINLLCIQDASDRRKTIRLLSQQNTELSDLRHIKTHLNILLSDEEYEADLQNHTIPSEPDQHRICESVER